MSLLPPPREKAAAARTQRSLAEPEIPSPCLSHRGGRGRNFRKRSALAYIALVSLVLAIAFWLGTHDLERQSLWPDEAFSWDFARQPLGALTRGVLHDLIHVPGYYVLLHYWMLLAGSSPFSLRFFSVVPGVLAIAVLYALGRRLIGRLAAALAALLAAIHPFLVYYRQEARMYALLLLVVLLALWLMLRWARKPTTGRWLAYVTCVALSLYIHYTAVLLIPVLALAPLIPPRRGWRLVWRNWAALCCSGLLFVPWAVFGLREFSTFAPVTAAEPRLGQWTADFWLALASGEMSYETRRQIAATAGPWLLVALLGALLVLGAVRGPASLRRRGLLALLLVLPLVLVLAIAIEGRDFSPRYDTVSLAGFLLLLPLGLLALPGRAVQILGVLVVCAGFVAYDYEYFTNPAFQRQDFRGAIQHALSLAIPSDAVILLSQAPLTPIWRYYAGAEPTTLHQPLPDSPQGLDTALRAAVDNADRVHLVLWQDFAEDPQQRVRPWFEANEHRMGGFGAGEVAVYDYATYDPLEDTPPSDIVPLQADFSGQLALLGYREWSGWNGQGLRLQLVWRRLQPIGRDFHVFVHLVDAKSGNLAVADHRPAFDNLNLSQWHDRPILIDEYDLSGDLRRASGIEIGLYDPASGQRLSPQSLSLPLTPN